jgi:microcystin-dependent protein
LTVQQIPTHTHPLLASTAIAGGSSPANSVLGQGSNVTVFRAGAATVAMNAGAIGPVGGNQPHTNFQPYLCINFIISLFGIFPSPS